MPLNAPDPEPTRDAKGQLIFSAPGGADRRRCHRCHGLMTPKVAQQKNQKLYRCGSCGNEVSMTAF
jgi:NAD-dependent SIR2 family protein deacetylase